MTTTTTMMMVMMMMMLGVRRHSNVDVINSRRRLTDVACRLMFTVGNAV